VLTGYLTRAPQETGDWLRLFCLHHAGGAASSFNGWAAELGPPVDVLPVQLPGREGRVAEPRPRDMAALVEELAAHLGPHLRPPYVLYGHSMGALVSYALVLALQERGLPLPERLVVGAYPAPDEHRFMADVPAMPLDDLARLLVRIGGMSQMVLGYPDWRDAAVALVREDLRLCHSFEPEGEGVRCALHAFAGESDTLMTPAEAEGWGRYTEGPFRLHRLPGGHFFTRDAMPAFLAELRAVLGLPNARRTGRHTVG
jgi:surfactin synthase thioesterase subunit